jgi:hypothetical protein
VKSRRWPLCLGLPTPKLTCTPTESESSTARANESQFKCSQYKSHLYAQLRITDLETKVKKLMSARKYRCILQCSHRPAGTCMYIRALSDIEAVAHDPGIPDPRVRLHLHDCSTFHHRCPIFTIYDCLLPRRHLVIIPSI